MPSPRADTPRRVPPPSVPTPPASPPVASVAQPHRPVPPNLTTEADVLQAQLDELARQFEWLRLKLRQAQKLATLGTTAAMIAHEVNNLLTPIVAYAREAVDRDEIDLMRTALRKTLERTAVIIAMVDRVTGLARQSDTAVRPVGVRQAVLDAIGCLGRDPARDNIAVNLQIDEALAVKANPSRLLQVLLNLVTNARQAMLGRRGRLTIDAAPTGAGQVEINVRDNGCGIPAGHIESIFDPFFSTKSDTEPPDHRGLGLGLCISRDIVEELGGTIRATSEVGVGSTFTVTLPIAE